MDCTICRGEVDTDHSYITMLIAFGREAMMAMREQNLIEVPDETLQSEVDSVTLCYDCGHAFMALLNGMLLMNRNVALMPMPDVDIDDDGIG